LKEADLAFQEAMRGLDIDLERVHAGDRANARQRQVETKDGTPAVMGYIILLGFFCLLFSMLFVSFPTGSKEALLILLGVLGGMASAITNYYFGSSVGSDLKTKLMARKTDGAT
jgi:UDP-N-acetylmuramyl pentapeptide phosphotransferase/UDP-N-acetylglucosamine-1-phosphate transferase